MHMHSQQIQTEKQKTHERLITIESYLLDSRDKVDAEDAKALQREEAKLGLPVLQPLHSLIDSAKFRFHGLLAPDMYLEAPQPQQPRPQAESVLHHTTHTESSYEKVVLLGPTPSNIRNEASDFKLTRHTTLGKLKATTSESTSRRSFDKRNERGVSALALERHSDIVGSRPRTPFQKPVLFKSVPEEVLFDEYKTAETRSMAVRLINESASSQSIRILPPAATNFTITSITFPGHAPSSTSNVGRIAAGLVCECMVTFLADTLADYSGELVVVPEHGERMAVKLLARRPAPALGLPATVDCGPCQLTQTATISLPVCNTGAVGRFRFGRKAEAPNAAAIATMPDAFWSESGPLVAGPFVLKQAAYTLSHMERATVDVVFTGTEISKCTEEIVLLVDNGTVHDFTFAGQCEIPSIRMVGLAGGFKRVERKASDLYTGVFNDVYPGVPAARVVTLANDSQMAIPFSWDTHFEAAREAGGIPFTISPSSGELAPESSCEFELCFETSGTGYSEGSMCLNVASIPGADETFLTLDLSGTCVPYDVQILPSLLPIPGDLELGRIHSRDVEIRNTSGVAVNYMLESAWSAVAGIVPVPSAGKIAANSSQRVQLSISPRCAGQIRETLNCYIDHSETPIPLHVEACIGPVQVKLDEPSVDFGLVRIGEYTESEITFRNCSAVPAAWQFVLNPISDGEGDGNADVSYEFTPSVGQLPPLGEATVAIKYHAKNAGRIRHTVACIVGGGPDKLLELTALVQVPQARLLQPSVDLGTLFCGTPVRTTAVVMNVTSLTTDFAVAADASLFSCTPSSGTLGPKEQQTIEVEFSSSEIGAFSHGFDIAIDGATSPPLRQSFTGSTIGASVEFLTKQDARVTLPQATVPENLLETYGFTQDMSSGAGADAPAPAAALALNFGKVKTGAIDAIQEFTIKNTSAIAVDVQFDILGFPVAPDMYDPTKKVALTTAVHGNAFATSAARGMSGVATTGRGPAPPRAKTTMPSFMKSATRRASSPRASRTRVTNISQDFSTVPYGTAEVARVQRSVKQRGKAALASNSGVAFEVKTTHAMIEPFGEVTVTVQCYSDTWGKYTDVLRCTSSLVPTKDIAIEANVLGSPVTFQMGTNTTEDPIVRLGQVTTCHSNEADGTQAVTCCTTAHSLKLKNPSPFDVNLRWECYLTSPATGQLVDLLCYDDGGDQIKLHCRPHEGVWCDKPFTVDPASSTVVLGRDRNLSRDAVKVHFKSPVAGEFLGLVRGIMTMKNPADVIVSRAIPGDAATQSIGVDRTIATDDDKELRFYMTASAATPHVVLPAKLDRFKCGVTDMIETGRASSTISVVMSNTTTAKLALSLATNAPFAIEDVEFGGVASLNGNGILLPGQSLRANVAMGISSKVLMQLCMEDMQARHNAHSRAKNMKQTFEALDLDGNGIITQEELDEARQENSLFTRLRSAPLKKSLHKMDFADPEGKLRVGEPLTVTFLDGSQQSLDLLAEVPISILGLDCDEVDFGVCLVGTPTRKRVTITNTGLAHTAFQSDCSTGSAFACLPNQGPLDGFTSNITNNSMVVEVEYTPPSEGFFEDKVYFRGALGEPPLLLKVFGQGSIDECVEDTS